MIGFLEPLELDKAIFSYVECEDVGREVPMVDGYAILRDTPTRSYVISNPCIRGFNGDDEKARCLGVDRKDGCVNHYQNMIYMADNDLIDVKDIRDLKRSETAIAHLPPNLYWKFIQTNGYPERRKEFFIRRVGSAGMYLEKKILKDLTGDKIRTRKKLFNYVQDKVGDLGRVDFPREAERYSFATNIGDILQKLELIANATLMPIQMDDDGIVWYLSGGTEWNADQYFVLELQDNEASIELIKVGTKHSASIVHRGPEKTIEQIILDEALLSPKGTLARIAQVLDDNRWSKYIDEIPAEV